jgi:hypothetical protein
MDRHLAAKICRFCVADLRNGPLLRAIHAPKEVPLGCALYRYILIDNLLGPDLFRGSLDFKRTGRGVPACDCVIGLQRRFDALLQAGTLRLNMAY